jgi:hypothetical protein
VIGRVRHAPRYCRCLSTEVSRICDVDLGRVGSLSFLLLLPVPYCYCRVNPLFGTLLLVEVPGRFYGANPIEATPGAPLSWQATLNTTQPSGNPPRKASHCHSGHTTDMTGRASGNGMGFAAVGSKFYYRRNDTTMTNRSIDQRQRRNLVV